MKPFNYELINIQIKKFEDESEQDYDEVLYYYNNQILQDMTYPYLQFAAFYNIIYLLSYIISLTHYY